MSVVGIYKRGQGRHTRIATFVGVMVLVVVGAERLSEYLGGGYGLNPMLQYGISTLLVVVAAAVMFWMVNRPKSADFMIATEGEMKKVSWSTKKEIAGSTKVVLVTTIIIATVLYCVDNLFIQFFKVIHVLV